MTTVREIYNYIDKIAPYENMEPWDNSGFTLGDIDRAVNTVVVALDATALSAEFARSQGAELLLTHHPLIFNPLKKIEADSVIYKLISYDICAMCAHTSFDKANGGINDNLASLFELQNTMTLENGYVVVGDLPQDMSIDDFAALTAEILGTSGLRYTDTEKIIKRVAVGGGACGEFWREAMENADCFITGEAKYHEMLDAAQAGFSIINAGHFETENIPFLMLADKLQKAFPDVDFIKSPIENPVKEL